LKNKSLTQVEFIILGGKMKAKAQSTIKNESSQKLNKFLEEKNVHKKDFAQMIGVTLSYVYSLIDNSIPFSSRGTTLERIATVMGIRPEDFKEYTPSDEPKIIDVGIQLLQHKQKMLKMSNVDFLRKFPKNKRTEIVDLWRGALPLPLDWKNLMNICYILDVSADEIFPYWQSRMQQHMMAGGIDPMANSDLMDAMFEAARHQIGV
jgi:DNA-binding Xre family transcriptional regulator